MSASSCPLTVIVVEYFSRPHLDGLMNSLAQFEPGAPVIISSNSVYSAEETRRMIAAFPAAKFIRNERNLGYAGGVNRALALGETPYAAILNPDVALTRGIAARTQAVFGGDAKLGMFGPKILDGAGEPTCSFRRFYPPQFILARYFGLAKFRPFRAIPAHYLMKETGRDAFCYADWISGGAMFVRMEAARAVGGMDERYFLYMEDMDWCRSFWRAGWRVGYAPEPCLIHRAQHAGTRRGLSGVFTRATRRQILGYAKYVCKWGLRRYAPAADIEHGPDGARASHPVVSGNFQ